MRNGCSPLFAVTSAGRREPPRQPKRLSPLLRKEGSFLHDFMLGAKDQVKTQSEPAPTNSGVSASEKRPSMTNPRKSRHTVAFSARRNVVHNTEIGV